jgi:hypothetical protein
MRLLIDPLIGEEADHFPLFFFLSTAENQHGSGPVFGRSDVPSRWVSAEEVRFQFVGLGEPQLACRTFLGAYSTLRVQLPNESAL